MAIHGFAPWNPKPETLYWVRQVEEVLAEYKDYLPISLRQVFYALTDRGFEKSERAYGNLVGWVARARRAQLLPIDAFSDEQGREHAVLAFDGEAGFWSSVRDDFEHYRRERMTGQPVRAEVWSEATGIGKQLQRVAWRYGIPVYISRGYTSVTNVWNLVQRALEFDGHTVVFHIGDYDPSGVGLFKSLRADASAFLAQERAEADPDRLVREDGSIAGHLLEDSGPWIRFQRVALTEEQIEEHGVETAPKKHSDARSASWVGETAQAEALPPDLLARIVTDAIEEELDMDRYAEEVGKEEADRDSIREVLEEVPGG